MVRATGSADNGSSGGIFRLSDRLSSHAAPVSAYPSSIPQSPGCCHQRLNVLRDNSFDLRAIADRIHVGCGGAQSPVDNDSLINCDTGTSGEVDSGTQSNRLKDHMSIQLSPIGQAERDAVIAASTEPATDRLRVRAEMESNTEALKTSLNRLGSRRRQKKGQTTPQRLNHLNFESAECEIVCELAADLPGADNEHLSSAVESASKPRVLIEVVHCINKVGCVAAQGESICLRADSKHEFAVFNRITVGYYLSRSGIQSGPAHSGMNRGT